MVSEQNELQHQVNVFFFTEFKYKGYILHDSIKSTPVR